jgi:hypothetical protein
VLPPLSSCPQNTCPLLTGSIPLFGNIFYFFTLLYQLSYNELLPIEETRTLDLRITNHNKNVCIAVCFLLSKPMESNHSFPRIRVVLTVTLKPHFILTMQRYKKYFLFPNFQKTIFQSTSILFPQLGQVINLPI